MLQVCIKLNNIVITIADEGNKANFADVNVK